MLGCKCIVLLDRDGKNIALTVTYVSTLCLNWEMFTSLIRFWGRYYFWDTTFLKNIELPGVAKLR